MTKNCICSDYNEDLTFIDPIFKLPHIKTPYQMKIITNVTEGFWWENQKLNYIPYDFFVLKTRLRSVVPMSYDINFSSYQYETVMIFLVEFDTAYEKVKLTLEEADHYQQLVNDYVKYNHCELILSFKDLVWQNSVLPFTKIDKQYDPIFINDKLLINIHPHNTYQDDTIKGSEVSQYYLDYQDVYLQLQDQIHKKLKKMYHHVVVANAIVDKEVIDEWELIPISDVINGNQLYQTTNNRPGLKEALFY